MTFDELFPATSLIFLRDQEVLMLFSRVRRLVVKRNTGTDVALTRIVQARG